MRIYRIPSRETREYTTAFNTRSVCDFPTTQHNVTGKTIFPVFLLSVLDDEVTITVIGVKGDVNKMIACATGAAKCLQRLGLVGIANPCGPDGKHS
jgi:hypothetical protein